MPEKEPVIFNVLTQIGTIAYIVMIGSLAGIVGYLNRIEKTNKPFKWQWLIASFLAGGFNGYLVFLLCDLANWGWQITAFLTGASGAMGSEGLHMLTRKANNFLKGQ